MSSGSHTLWWWGSSFARFVEVCLLPVHCPFAALNARPATRDVDALFKPAKVIREAAARVASAAGVPDTWLNDAVEAYLSPHGEYDDFIELSHLRVFVAQPGYLLAKCAALRLGEKFHDPLTNVRYLLRHLNIRRAEEALAIVTRYFDEDQLRPKTRLALEELLSGERP